MSVLVYFAYLCLMKVSKVRTSIIETASTLFYKNGYNRTGINEIIKEAGVAKATLYSHFASKDDICVAYLQYMNRNLLQEIEAKTKMYPKGRERVLGLFEFLVNFFNSESFNGCWCIKTVAEISEESDKILEEIHVQKQALLKFINELVDKNIEFKDPQEVKILAGQLYVLYEGALSESYLHNDCLLYTSPSPRDA